MTREQRQEAMKRIEKLIGTKAEARALSDDLSERINNVNRYNKQFDELMKVFEKNGEKALAMNFIQEGRSARGITASGKRWTLDANHGWTERSRYCGTLWIEGEGTIFTSGRIDKVFDYILNA